MWRHTATTPVPFFIPKIMKRIFTIHYSLLIASLLLAGCNPNEPEPVKGRVIAFEESDSIFANPERGIFAQGYYTSANLNSRLRADVIRDNRKGANKMSLYLNSYYLTDYMESDIPQAFLERLDSNMNALRIGGAKAIVRFSYKSSMDARDKPWNATPEWIHKHIDQVAPYLQKNADVILCIQCGWIGSWGEWYYTDSGYKMNPSKDSDFEMRWELLEHYLSVVPESRQIGLRIPSYKMRYLKMRGDTTMSPLSASEAYQNTYKARICGHNDCFVSSSNDVGTYFKESERAFWAEDTKYTFMGGETCEKCQYSEGTNAIKEMEKYHWTYLNKDYRESVTGMWRQDGTMNTMMKRLGYRFVLDRAVIKDSTISGEGLQVYFELHNAGFAAPNNKRDVELIVVNATNPSEKYVFPQNVDPRFWLPGEVHTFTLKAQNADIPAGYYKIYLNLPDPYESLHDKPYFSIRLANKNVWSEATGYNYITTVELK